MPNRAFNSKREIVQLGYRLPKSSSEYLALKKERYSCPHCENPMTLRSGLYYRAHFSHKSPCVAMWSHESDEHIFAKYFIQNLLQNSLGLEVRQEVRIANSERIADILLYTHSGYKIAIEIQLSKISSEEVIERTSSYKKNGIDVIWLYDAKKFKKTDINYKDSFFISIQNMEDDFHLDFIAMDDNFAERHTINNFSLSILEKVFAFYLKSSSTPETLSTSIYGNEKYVEECKRFFRNTYQFSHLTPKDVINFIHEEKIINSMSCKIRAEEKNKLILAFSNERAALNNLAASLNIESIKERHEAHKIMMSREYEKEKDILRQQIKSLQEEIKCWKDYEEDMINTLKKRYIDPELKQLAAERGKHSKNY